MNARFPVGYLGKDHVTIGSDLLAVVSSLKFPEHVLGKDLYDRLVSVQSDHWYPIAEMLSMLDAIDARVGHYGLIAVGRRIFLESHRDSARAVSSSARELFDSLNELYHAANRGGAIGGWQVLEFSEDHADLQKTTPHHCSMEHGLLHAALEMLGIRSSIAQRECFRRGDASCIFSISVPPRTPNWDHSGPAARPGER